MKIPRHNSRGRKSPQTTAPTSKKLTAREKAELERSLELTHLFNFLFGKFSFDSQAKDEDAAETGRLIEESGRVFFGV